MKKAMESSDPTREVRVPLEVKTPARSKLPLFSWRKSTRYEDTEIIIGPSLAWVAVILLAILKGLGGATLLPMLWRVLP